MSWQPLSVGWGATMQQLATEAANAATATAARKQLTAMLHGEGQLLMIDPFTAPHRYRYGGEYFLSAPEAVSALKNKLQEIDQRSPQAGGLEAVVVLLPAVSMARLAAELTEFNSVLPLLRSSEIRAKAAIDGLSTRLQRPAVNAAPHWRSRGYCANDKSREMLALLGSRVAVSEALALKENFVDRLRKLSTAATAKTESLSTEINAAAGANKSIGKGKVTLISGNNLRDIAHALTLPADVESTHTVLLLMAAPTAELTVLKERFGL